MKLILCHQDTPNNWYGLDLRRWYDLGVAGNEFFGPSISGLLTHLSTLIVQICQKLFKN